MNRLLGPKGQASLESLAVSRSLLAFDFDGTLAPIVADRDAAGLSARTRDLLSRLCRLYPCAVISGRGLEDVQERVRGTGVRHVVGGHGLEPSDDLAEYETVSREAARLLRARLANVEGVELEVKRGSLAVHYRRAPQARALVEEAVGAIALPVRAIGGRKVVNLVPQGAPDKGVALLSLMRSEGVETALYVGDDDTDEDVFRLGADSGVVRVRVGASVSSMAEWYLDSQAEVDVLLERLVALRETD